MFELARANYSGVFGVGPIEGNPREGRGTFFQNSRIRFADILDGQSNTLLIGERSSRLDYATWVGAVPGAYRGMARIVGTAGSVPNHVLNDFADFGSHHPVRRELRHGQTGRFGSSATKSSCPSIRPWPLEPAEREWTCQPHNLCVFGESFLP